MFYLVVISGLIVCHQVFIYLKQKRFDPLGVDTLLDMAIFALFVYSYVNDPLLAAAVDMRYCFYIASGIFALYVGLELGQRRFLWRSTKLRSEPDQMTRDLSPRVLWLFAMAWIGLRLFSVMNKFHTSGSTNLIEFSARSRTASYLQGDILSGNLWPEYLAMAFFLLPTITLLQWLLDHRKRIQAALLFGIMLLTELWLFQSRYVFLLTLLLPFAYIHIRVRPFRLVEVLAAGVGVLCLLAVLDGWRTYGLENLDLISALSPRDNILRDLNPSRAFDTLYQMDRDGLLQYDYFYQYLLIPVSYVPRALWPDKPIVSFSPRYTEIIFGNWIGGESGSSVATFTVFGEGIAMWGWIGIVITGLLIGFGVGFVKRTYLANRWLGLAYMYFVLNIPMSFRGSGSDFLGGPILNSLIFIFVTSRLAERRVSRDSYGGQQARNAPSLEGTSCVRRL
jgi:hypothetical protein